MIQRTSGAGRTGVTAVEAAVVFPAVLLLLFGLLVGGMGVFRYQELSHLARETARFASTHGGQYAKENASAIQGGALPNVDRAYLMKNVVLPRALGMDPNNLQVQIAINSAHGTFDWDATAQNANRAVSSSVTQNKNTIAYQNTVSVTVTYQWLPEVFVVGPITLTSTAVLPMSY